MSPGLKAEFESQDPHGRRNLVPASCPLTSPYALCMPSQLIIYSTDFDRASQDVHCVALSRERQSQDGQRRASLGSPTCSGGERSAQSDSLYHGIQRIPFAGEDGTDRRLTLSRGKGPGRIYQHEPPSIAGLGSCLPCGYLNPRALKGLTEPAGLCTSLTPLHQL